uniref:Gustatory receptor n=1 Tax=Lutzomyia longipalpis TaxID=7200 RepID=A0A240SXW4_LUTLO
MESQTIFQGILHIFQFLGLCPVSLETSKDNPKKIANTLLGVWSIVNFALVLALTTVVFINYDSVFSPDSDVGQFNDLVKFVTVILTHGTALGEAILTRATLLSAWTRLTTVDNLFHQIGIPVTQHRMKFFRDFSAKFLIYTTLTLTIELTILATIHFDANWTRNVAITFISLLVSRMRHLHLTMFVDLIRSRLHIVRKELKQMVVITKNNHFVLKDELATKRIETRLVQMKKIYSVLWECHGDVNSSFGWSELAALMQNFIQLTCDLYWIYSVLNRNELRSIPQLVASLIPTFTAIIIMLHSCEKCLNDVRHIGFWLHNIEKDIHNISMDTLMVAAITTYMVIFIQFMPKVDESNSANETITTTTQYPFTLAIPTRPSSS